MQQRCGMPDHEHLQKISEQYKNYKAKTLGNFNENDLKSYIEYSAEDAFLRYFKGKDYWGDIVIDFGGRVGDRTRRLRNVTVVEIAEDSREYMKKLGIRHETSIDKFKDGSVDLIFASHVLEHLHDPYEYLVKFRNKLKKGGKLMLVLPVEDHRERGPGYYDENGHMYCWNIKTINTLLRYVGFKVKESKVSCSCGLAGLIRVILQKLGVKNKTIAEFNYHIITNILGRIYVKGIMKIFPYVPFGGEFYILAEKE